MLDSYKFLEEAVQRESTTIKDTKITVEEIIKQLGYEPVSDSNITALVNDPKYSGLLKEEYVREVLLYFENNKREVKRRILFKEHIAKTRPLILQCIAATRITEEDLNLRMTV